MLPDFWRMAHRRVRPKAGIHPPRGASNELAALLAGVEHHLEADDAFHRHPVFVRGEKRLAQCFREAAIGADKIGLFAHIGWELCLDGALLRRVGVEETLDRLRGGLAAAEAELAAAVRRHRSAVPEGFDGRLDHLLEQVAWSDWVPGYRSGDGVARRLAGVRRRVRLSAFTDDDLQRLGRVFDQALDDADPAVAELLDG